MLKKVPKNILSLPSRDTPLGFSDDIVSPIFPILTAHPVPLALYLRQYGYACAPVQYPTVPRGKERVRVVVHAGNKPEELEELVARLLEWAAAMQEQEAKARL